MRVCAPLHQTSHSEKPCQHAKHVLVYKAETAFPAPLFLARVC
jgi:hypothetical protein